MKTKHQLGHAQTGQAQHRHSTASHLLYALVLGLLLMLAVPQSAALAAPGDLDSTFGPGGIVTSDLNDSGASDVAIQSDGKLVVVGETGSCSGSGEDFACHSEFLVERYNSNGTPDTSFGGGDGIVTTDFGNESQGAAAVQIDSSGRLLVGGETYNEDAPEFALARYNPDGSLDTAFGAGDGMATTGLSDVEGINVWSGSMVLQPDGKIVLGGAAYVLDGFGTWHMALARFNSDGSVDTSFGTGGKTIGPAGHPFGLAEESSGKLLAAGRAGSSEFAVVRFNGDGSLDNSFGGDGIATLDLSPVGSQADDVLVQPDGKIVASGFGSGLGFAVARLNTNGTVDTTFGGGDGLVLTDFSKPCCGVGAAISVALQADGRIVFAGQWNPDEDSLNMEWAVGRLYSHGAPDMGFGTAGMTTTDVAGGGYGNYASGVAIQGDGRIVAVGSTGAPDLDLAVARYEGGLGPPEPLHHHLRIDKSGPGGGIVTAPELYCGANCAADYPEGETVVVNAFADFESSTFTGWSTTSGNPGTCTGMITPCEVTLSGDVELVATFDADPPAQHTLTVKVSGGGSVVSSPAGINCNSVCSASFFEGEAVRLTATANPGWFLLGWSWLGGAPGCTFDESAPHTCDVALTEDAEINAEFKDDNDEGGKQGPPDGNSNQPPTTNGSTPPPAASNGGNKQSGQKRAQARKRALKKCKKLKGKARRRCVRKANASKQTARLALAADLNDPCVKAGLAKPKVLEAWVRHPGDRKTQGMFVEADWPALPKDCDRHVRVPSVRFQLQSPRNHARWINVGGFATPERRSWEVKEELEAEKEAEGKSCWEISDAGKTFACDIPLHVTSKGGEGTAYAPESPAWPDPEPRRDRYRYRCTPGPGKTHARALIKNVVKNLSTDQVAQRTYRVPVKVKSYSAPPQPGHPKRGALQGPC